MKEGDDVFSFRQLKPPAATVGASLDSAALAASLGGNLNLWTTQPVVGGKARSEQQVLHQQQMEQLTMSHKKILAQVLAQHQTTTTMTNNNNININIGRAS